VSSGAEPVSRARAACVLALLFAVLAFSLIDRHILSILLEDIKRDLGVSDTAMGFLSGLAFALTNAIAGVPLARLADRSSRRTIVAAGLAAWSLLTALQGLAGSFVFLALTRIGVGIGEATTGPSAHSLISDHYPPRQRASAIAIYTMGGHFGVFIGLALGGWLNEAYGWRTAFVAVGLPGLLVALLVQLGIREPVRGQIEGRSEERGDESAVEVMRYLWSRRSFRHLACAAPLFVLSFYAFNVWGPVFLMRVHGMPSSEAGLSFGTVTGICGAAGTLCGGLLGDWLAKRDVRWYLRFPALAALGMLPFCIGFLFSPDPRVALAFLAPMMFLGAVFIAPLHAVAQGIARLRMRAMASALVHLSISAIGGGLGPQLIGILNDLFAGSAGSEAVRYSLLLVILTNGWGALHAFSAMRTVEADLAAAHEPA